ncbi:MAG: carbon-nitrogen hydrolase family protein [Anaerolineae bacterium]
MKVKVAAVQLNTKDNKEENLSSAEQFIDQAVQEGAQFIALPETFNFLSEDEDETRANAEEIPGPTIERMMAKAREHGVFLHCGSIAERSAQTTRLFNTTVLLGPHGEIIARYRKIHLYDADLGPDLRYLESALYEPGRDIVSLEAGGMKIGLTICYDLRFPELFRILAVRGAEVIFLPANFTFHTGRDHWEVLIRARAIENQLFMVAPAQVGYYGPRRRTYGHSMIVDPWGRILSEAPDEPSVVTAELDLATLHEVRQQLPSLANRCPAVYQGEEPLVEVRV